MNSLNLLSSRVIGQSPRPSRPRSRSQNETIRATFTEELLRGRSRSEEKVFQIKDNDQSTSDSSDSPSADSASAGSGEIENEKQPLLSEPAARDRTSQTSGLRSLIKRLTDAITAILTTVGLPIAYIVKCFQDEDGKYSPLEPFRSRTSTKDQALHESPSEKPANRAVLSTKLRHSYSSESLNSTASISESDSEQRKSKHGQQRHTGMVGEEAKPRRQSARIKLMHNDEAAQKRKRRSGLADQFTSGNSGTLTVDSLKSPTSTSASLRATRYPHTPNTPRPLIPRRQPSYSNMMPPHLSPRSLASVPQQKTLVLDLDETLIHSLAKGGRMSTGHMVEVKLNVPVAVPASVSGQPLPAVLGPQHPILYYVHKRPHCDEFLRKVCKWFKLVVFTASVQEYADPVIDWLEQERKFFAGRYYRQHCTFRNGSYIKDLSSIEPDLSKVVILDNSPVSYIFHEDNAIPIEGWINDPTDNDLLHLIPMLEALQFVTDVRALLALRRGEAEAA